jgi:peptidoglycan hydrolase-like protein with peptidoglycan-binding domain
LEQELNLGNHISKYYQSFSGTDTLAFIMMPGSSPVVIGSLTTISYSMFRNKKPVINIGRTNINGVTRGSRIFAGTMIFTLINQHWLKELQEQLDWLKGFDELKVDELPLFDIMIISANEYGNAVAMYIYGIDFTDEAQTISVEDLFTENTFSFVARDISNFKRIKKKPIAVSSNPRDIRNDFSQRLYVLNSSPIDLNDLARLEKEMTLSKLSQLNNTDRKMSLGRDLYFSSSKMMMGNDVANIQTMLNQTKLFDIPVNGIFDDLMDKAVRKFQSLFGLDISGVVDDKLYNSLINQTNGDGKQCGVVVNKYGAYVYKHPSLLSDIVDVKNYKEQVNIHEIVTSDDDSEFHKWYKLNTGYVVEEDIYSAYHTGGIVEFPTIEYNDNSSYVTMIQSALADIFPSFTNVSGTYDYTTQQTVKQLQKENGMNETGIVDNNTWLMLQQLAGNIASKLSNDNFKMDLKTPPGVYDISKDNIFDAIKSFGAKISCDNFIPVKASAICIFDDGTSETLSKTISTKNSNFSLEEFQNAFVYNPKHGKSPKQVDYVVYPHNKKPFKWTIKS